MATGGKLDSVGGRVGGSTEVEAVATGGMPDSVDRSTEVAAVATGGTPESISGRVGGSAAVAAVATGGTPDSIGRRVGGRTEVEAVATGETPESGRGATEVPAGAKEATPANDVACRAAAEVD